MEDAPESCRHSLLSVQVVPFSSGFRGACELCGRLLGHGNSYNEALSAAEDERARLEAERGAGGGS